MNNKNGKVLVTGGAGYIGSALIPRLLEENYEVRVLDKLMYGNQGLSDSLDKIELVVGDILNAPTDIMEGIDSVIHLAGVSSQATAAYNSPRYTDKLNHIGTELIAQMAKQKGVERFIFASSCSIYCSYKQSPASEAPIFNEDDKPPMAGPYALSKRAAEEALLEMADNTFHPIILRKGTVYGFSPKMRYDLVINSFTKDAFSKKEILVNAGGEIYRPMVDIKDIINAYITALRLPIEKVSGQIFNIVNENQKIGDLAYEFKRIIKEYKGIDINLDIRPFEVVFNYKADNKKYRNVFESIPSRPLSDAILEIWNHLENGHDFENKKYYNDIWHMESIKQGLI